MNIADLPEVVKRTWDAIAAPAAELAATIVVLSYAIGLDRIQSLPGIPFSPEALTPSQTARDALAFYGLNVIIPVATIGL